MIKKTLLAGGALALLIALVFGRSAMSYVKTGVGMARDTVRNSVSVEFDLKRARDEIKSLEPEIRKNIERIANEEAQIGKLDRKVTRADEDLAQMKSEILRLTNDLETNSSNYFVYTKDDGGELSFTREHVKRELKARFSAYQSKDQEKSHYADILEARKETLMAAQEKLVAMRDAKSSLEVDVERLEAKLEMVKVAKAKSEFKFDDSKLSRVRKLIEDIDTRIEVESKLADSSNQYPLRIPLGEETGSVDITEKVHDYFSDDSELAKQ